MASSMDDTGVTSKTWTKREKGITPMIDYNLGLAWVRGAGNETYALGLKLAYESHVLYGANQYMVGLNVGEINQFHSVNVNLSFQGMT